jgi:hypothetical protein
MGQLKNGVSILVGKPEGTIPLGRSRRGWEDNIKMYLREIGWRVCGLDASSSGYGSVAVNTVMNLRVS